MPARGTPAGRLSAVTALSRLALEGGPLDRLSTELCRLAVEETGGLLAFLAESLEGGTVLRIQACHWRWTNHPLEGEASLARTPPEPDAASQAVRGGSNDQPRAETVQHGSGATKEGRQEGLGTDGSPLEKQARSLGSTPMRERPEPAGVSTRGDSLTVKPALQHWLQAPGGPLSLLLEDALDAGHIFRRLEAFQSLTEAFALPFYLSVVPLMLARAGVLCVALPADLARERECASYLEALASVLEAAIRADQDRTAMRISEARFGDLLESAPDAIVGVDGSGLIVLVNSQTERLFGYPRGELLGKSVELLLPEGHRPGHEAHRRSYSAEPRVRPMGVGRDLTARRKDGSVFPVEISLSPLRTERGLVVTSIIRDITERKQLEKKQVQLLLEQAREQEARRLAEGERQRFKFLAEAGNILATCLNEKEILAELKGLIVPRVADGFITSALGEEGQAVRMAVGAADPEMENGLRTLLEQPFTLRSRIPAALAMSAGTTVSYIRMGPDLVASLSDEPHSRTLLLSLGLRAILSVPLVARGRLLGALSYLWVEGTRTEGREELQLAEELTARVALAIDSARLYHEAKEASLAKDNFLATVSHELRTPLTSILGWSRLLLTHPRDQAGMRRGLETIERNANAQARLVEDMLDVSRIIAGKLHIEPEEVDLEPLVQDVLESFRPQALARQLRLHADFNGQVPPVWGDPQRLQQVVWNLLSNALKFTPSGGQVWVRLGQKAGMVCLEVEDTGQGIRSALLPHIFEAFRQAEEASTRRHGGLGLGLAIVRHLVPRHGGRVEVESEGEGKGSTFRVLLPPLASGGQTTKTHLKILSEPARENPTRPTCRLSGMRVLVLDLQPDEQSLSAVVASLGAEVAVAQDELSAVAKIASGWPELLLVGLPLEWVAEGPLAQALASRAQGAGGLLPAVATSPKAAPADRMKLLAAGFQLHLQRPLEPLELCSVLHGLVRGGG